MYVCPHITNILLYFYVTRNTIKFNCLELFTNYLQMLTNDLTCYIFQMEILQINKIIKIVHYNLFCVCFTIFIILIRFADFASYNISSNLSILKNRNFCFHQSKYVETADPQYASIFVVYAIRVYSNSQQVSVYIYLIVMNTIFSLECSYSF